MDEYLEELFARSFDREGAQEEHVVSSLPFFIAALALAVTVLGFIVDKLPKFDLSLYSLLTYTLVALAGLSMAGVLPWLFVAMRPRLFRIPPKETEMQEWAGALRDYYFGQGLRGDRLQAEVVRELRQWMIGEYAEATIQNRAHNASRKAARTQGVMMIVFALTFSFAIVGTTFVHDRILLPLKLVSVSNGSPPATNAIQSRQAGAAAGSVRSGGGAVAVPQTASPSGQRGQVTNSPAAPPAPNAASNQAIRHSP